MSKKDFKPQLVKFQKFQFETALKNYTQKVKIENQIENYFFKVLDAEATPDLNKDLYIQAIDILQNNTDNLMRLDGQKYAELKRINLSELKALQIEYNKVKKYNAPHENDYSIFTQNEKENANLKIYSDFVTAYYNLIGIIPDYSYNRYDFYKAFSNWIEWSHSTHTAEPSEKLIKL